MTPENFIYWLQGKLEIGDTKSLSEQEVQVIKDHINLVLKKETPVRQQLILPQDFGQKTLPYLQQRTLLQVPECKCGNLKCTCLGVITC